MLVAVVHSKRFRICGRDGMTFQDPRVIDINWWLSDSYKPYLSRHLPENRCFPTSRITGRATQLPDLKG